MYTCVKLSSEVTLALLTHGLVLGGDGGGVVENQDVSLKLPAGHWVLSGGQHHHALPDLVPPDLKKMEKQQLRSVSLSTIDAHTCIHVWSYFQS